MNNWNTKVTRLVKFTSRTPFSECLLCASSLKLYAIFISPQNSARPHHYPHFTDRKQNQRDLKSFTQGHTANNRGGRSWNSNCLVPKAKFFLWNIYLSCNPIVMSLLIFIIHGFSHSNVFLGFFFVCLFQLIEKYTLFMNKISGNLQLRVVPQNS